MIKTLANKYLPLILCETYLVFTLLLLYYGPMIWPIRNESLFLFFIFSYHIAFILGYVLAQKVFPKNSLSSDSSFEREALGKFWIVLLLATLGALISHRNLVHTTSYIPLSFFTDLKNGFLYPSETRAFYASSTFDQRFDGNKFFSSLLLVLGVFKYSLLPLLIYFWDQLSHIYKVVGVVVMFIPIASAISISVSSIGFSYVFFIAICLLMMFVKSGLRSTLINRKFFVALLVVLSLFSVGYFYSVKSKVSLAKAFTTEIAPERLDYLRGNGVIFGRDLSPEKYPVLTDVFEKMTMYLVNGYVGFSIALGEKFESSYGFGHSVFLTRFADAYIDKNIKFKTYQYKVSDRWHKDVFWHSAYTYFANDVGFYFVIVVMFVFGFMLSSVYLFAVLDNCLLSFLLMPLFGLFVLYIPANNQVFSFLETMSSFWILALLLVFKVKRKLYG